MVVFYDNVDNVFYVNLDELDLDYFLLNSNYKLSISYKPEQNCCKSFFSFLDKKITHFIYDLTVKFYINYVVF